MNKSRDYGIAWERDLVSTFKVFDNAKRKPNSGAFGTLTNDASLQGDVSFEVDGFRFLIEAKAGYGGADSITLQRAWLDKVTAEASRQSPARIPILALKMRNGRTENSKLIVMSLDTFVGLLKRIQELLEALDSAYKDLLKEKQKE